MISAKVRFCFLNKLFPLFFSAVFLILGGKAVFAEEEAGSWFDHLKKGVEDILTDAEKKRESWKEIPKSFKDQPTPEGIEFFDGMEREYARHLERRSIMKGIQDERTMGLIVNLQQPNDQADAPLFPVAAFIYNKPDLFGETDFTLVTALVFNRVDFSTPVNSDWEIGYAAEAQYGIAGSTLYYDGIEQKSLSYEGDSLSGELKLTWLYGEDLDLHLGVANKGRQYRIKNKVISDATGDSFDNPYRLPANHQDHSVFLEGQYGTLVTNLKFILDEALPLSGYAVRFRFAYHDRSVWEEWDAGTSESTQFEKYKNYSSQELSFHAHIPVGEFSEFNFQLYYGKVDHVDRENAFRIGGLGDVQQYRKVLHGYYDKEFYSGEYGLANLRFSLGLNKNNHILLYLDYLAYRDSELLISHKKEAGQMEDRKGVGIAYLITFLESHQLKLDIGYGADAERRDKKQVDDNGLIKPEYAEEKPVKGSSVATLHYQAWF